MSDNHEPDPKTSSGRDFRKFFQRLTGHKPYPYQSEMAEGSIPDVLEAETGLGKTEAVIVGWLYRYANNPDDTPRRLILVEPMRSLTDQVVETARLILQKAEPEFRKQGLTPPKVHQVIGGRIEEEWVLSPETPALIVGTQDMLLSRALMQGYGASRYSWPVQFGLLHNDAWWVFDEVQLMGSAIATSAQIEGFRRQLKTSRPSRTLWMSASMNRDWLGTVDFRHHLTGLRILRLGEADLSDPRVARIHRATKKVEQAATTLTATAKGERTYAAGLALEVLSRHRPGTTTLVFVNTVARAQEVCREISLLLQSDASRDTELILIHSRYRPGERRQRTLDVTNDNPADNSADRIVVTTQALEAGIDVSSATLFTELAPWQALLQRFGRNNRRGEFEQSCIFWIAIDPDLKGISRPYTDEELAEARVILATLEDAAPCFLPPVRSPSPVKQVIRLADFMDLFDTEPDLTGNDRNVARWIRDTDDVDVRLFWRNLGGVAPDSGEPPPDSEEICAAPVYGAQAIVDAKHPAYVWNSLNEAWERVGKLRPGMMVMLDAADGGYDENIGFSRKSLKPVPVLQLPDTAADSGNAGMSRDRESEQRPVTLARHSVHAVGTGRRICGLLRSTADITSIIETSLAWHDVGKAHWVYQGALDPPGEVPLAKAQHLKKYEIPFFRHELASAIACALHCSHPDPMLIAYLVACHHGKVRLRIAPVPGEAMPGGGKRRARGITDGDTLPAVTIPELGIDMPETTLSLDLMDMDGGDFGMSWSENAARLLIEHGPFRLAWLEALVRIADRVTSREENEAPDVI